MLYIQEKRDTSLQTGMNLLYHVCKKHGYHYIIITFIIIGNYKTVVPTNLGVYSHSNLMFQGM